MKRIQSSENGVVPDRYFWKGKKVFLTGHTGFKGSWLSLWLHSMGAQVTGYALEPPTQPSLFVLAGIDNLVTSVIGDVRDADRIVKAMIDSQADVVIHMAAQPLVRDSYKVPVDTYAVNVMGTVNLLEAVRLCKTVRAVINVTTDKCYENKEWVWGYRENEPLGGYDPYSSSKACSELVTAAYRNSYFNSADHSRHGIGIATVRAGNVIGGGDWATDRLIPDCIRAILRNEKIIVRHPLALRPWQHVLEPLCGYLILAEKLYNDGKSFSESWNFGPDDSDAEPVEWLVKTFCAKWGNDAGYAIRKDDNLHEAHYLKLDCSKSKTRLHWRPRWNLDTAVDRIVAWTQAYREGKDLQVVGQEQIAEYVQTAECGGTY